MTPTDLDLLTTRGFGIDQDNDEYIDYSRETKVESGAESDLFLVHRVTFVKESGQFYGTAIESDDYHENPLGESPHGGSPSVLEWLRESKRGSAFGVSA